MYNAFFGFHESPFNVTPNTQFFYTNDLYQEAFANLCYGIEWSKGLIVVSGEVGTGKTTLLYKTMRSLKATTRPVFLSYDQLTYGELLRHLSRELGLPGDAPDKLAMATRLRAHLLEQRKQGHIVALLIDEAQNLSEDMFEGVRFLSNFETEREKLLQIVLSGQPELTLRLDQPEQRHLKQRIFFHCRLTPLKNDEVGRYIEFRVQKAGFEGQQLFVPEAITQIASYSQGIPRVINIICDNALLLAFALSKKQVSKEMIQEVVRDLGLQDQSLIKAEGSASKADDEKWSFITKSELEREAEFVAGEPPAVKPDRAVKPAEPHAQPGGAQKSGPGSMAIAISVVLMVLAGAAGVLSSQQTREYIREVLQKGPAAEDRSEPTKGYDDSQTTAALPARVGAEQQIETDESRLVVANSQPTTPEVEQPKIQPPQPKAPTKEGKAASGLFKVVGPFSFVRRTPRADADIIATLQPATRLDVLSVRGDYFQVQALVEGRRIRGFVHREDAFFERAEN